MDRNNKFYNIIENLVRNHKKFNGYESILEDIIDDVYAHSQVVIESVSNEDVLNSYLAKVVSTSIITVPKKLNVHKEQKTISVSDIINTAKEKQTENLNLDNDKVSPFQEEKEQKEAKTKELKVNNELVDKMINSADPSLTNQDFMPERIEQDIITQEDANDILSNDIEIFEETNLSDTDLSNEEYISEEEPDLLQEESFISDFDTNAIIENNYEPEPISEDTNSEFEEEILEEQNFEEDTIPTLDDFSYTAENKNEQPEVLEYINDSQENIENVTNQDFPSKLFEDFEDSNSSYSELDIIPEIDTNTSMENSTEDLIIEDMEEPSDFSAENIEETQLNFEEADNNESFVENIDDNEKFNDIDLDVSDETEENLIEESDSASLNENLSEENGEDFNFQDQDFNFQSQDFNIQAQGEFEDLSTDGDVSLEQFDDTDLMDATLEGDSDDIFLTEQTEKTQPKEDHTLADFSIFDYTPSETDNSSEIKYFNQNLAELNKAQPDLKILEIFKLKYLEKLSVQQISESLGISEDSVIKALNKIIDLV